MVKVAASLRNRAVQLFDRVYALLRGDEAAKGFHELRYWKHRLAEEKDLSAGDWYQENFTIRFGLEPSFYQDKCVLDVGCGPRGSLEWATMAKERVGLDCLADSYKKLGADKHAMRYVNSGAEAIPFPDGHFDVVMTMNSLDHVDNTTKAINEIVRVVRPGGSILVLTSIDHPATPTEPQSFGMEVFDQFHDCQIVSQQRLERPEGETRWDIPYNTDDPTPRMSGVIVRLEKLQP